MRNRFLWAGAAAVLLALPAVAGRIDYGSRALVPEITGAPIASTAAGNTWGGAGFTVGHDADVYFDGGSGIFTYVYHFYASTSVTPINSISIGGLFGEDRSAGSPLEYGLIAGETVGVGLAGVGPDTGSPGGGLDGVGDGMDFTSFNVTVELADVDGGAANVGGIHPAETLTFFIQSFLRPGEEVGAALDTVGAFGTTLSMIPAPAALGWGVVGLGLMGFARRRSR